MAEPAIGAMFLVAFITLLFCFPGLVAVFLLREHRQRKDREDERQKERTSAKINRLRAALAATQAESERIGRNLHDSVTSRLSVIRGELGLCIEFPERFDPAKLEEIHKQLGEVLMEARNQSHRYTGHTLAHLGLTEAIRKEVHDMGYAADGTAIELDIVDFEDHYLSGLQSQHLYCIFMEGVNNALKHARAGTITVHLYTRANEVRLEITDDGCGFLPGESPGIGLKNMQHRTFVSEGSYLLDSKPGRGTTLLIKLPKHGETGYTDITT